MKLSDSQRDELLSALADALWLFREGWPSDVNEADSALWALLVRYGVDPSSALNDRIGRGALLLCRESRR